MSRGLQSLSGQIDKGPLEALPSLYRAFTLAGRSDDVVEKRIKAGWRQLQPSQRVQYLAGAAEQVAKRSGGTSP